MEIDKKLKLDRNNQHGYFFRVSRLDANAITDRRKYIELATQKAGVLFTTSELRDISQEYVEVSGAYETLQAQLVKEITGIVG
jgi:DNA mismatch repair protein MSH2